MVVGVSLYRGEQTRQPQPGQLLSDLACRAGGGCVEKRGGGHNGEGDLKSSQAHIVRDPGQH